MSSLMEPLSQSSVIHTPVTTNQAPNDPLDSLKQARAINPKDKNTTNAEARATAKDDAPAKQEATSRAELARESNEARQAELDQSTEPKPRAIQAYENTESMASRDSQSIALKA